MNKSIQLQPNIWKRLTLAAQADRISTAYIFSGPAGSGKEGLALAFAAYLNCQNPGESACGECSACVRMASLQHEHLQLIFPLPTGKSNSGSSEDPIQNLDAQTVEEITRQIQEKSNDPFYRIRLPKASRIIIQSIRWLRKSLFFKMVEPGRKIVLILEAQLLSAGQGEAANALLKMLEEPPPKTSFILVTGNKAGLLPTIVSRCQQVDFPPLEESVIMKYLNASGHSGSMVRAAAVLAGGDMGLARQLVQYSEKELLNEITALVKDFTRPHPLDLKKRSADVSRSLDDDPEEFYATIGLLQTWFALAYRSRTGDQPDLGIPAVEKELRHLIEEYPAAQFADINHVLEDLKEAPGRNLNLSLAITAAMLKIRRYLAGASRYSIEHEIKAYA